LLKDTEEVWVDIVLPDSPAHRVGLFPGDKLVEVDGHVVEGLTAEQLNDVLFKPDERRPMNLRVMRAGSVVSLKLETQKAREFTRSNFNTLVPSGGQRSGDDYVVGIEALQAENPREAIVAQVEYPSPAFDAGLHVGDLVLAINGMSIEEVDRQELGKLLAPNHPSEIALEVSRIGKKMTFRLTPVTYRTALAKIGRKPTELGPAPQHCLES
jgi:C-terminal processing protease CtpA/Prc